MRPITTTLAALAASLLLAGSALADSEPNNGITQAEGPLTGEKTYAGTLSTSDDVDWYAFYVSGQVQMDIALTVPGGAEAGVEATFRDSDGGYIGDASADANETDHFTYTTPAGTTRYLISFEHNCCYSPAGQPYQFKITTTPAGALVPGPGPAAVTPTGEPNESAAQAFGPLTGGVLYGGAIETSNDQDWFTFYTSGTQPFDLAFTNPGTDCGADGTLTRGTGDDGSSIGFVSPGDNQTEHVTHTPDGPAQYFLQVTSDCDTASYQLRVDPPSALASGLPAPPPPVVDPPVTGPSEACQRAQRSHARWRTKVRTIKRKLARTERASSRRKLRRKLGAAKRTRKRAKDRVVLNC